MFIGFSWSDSVTNDFYNSNDINLEYYSILFNLGVVYCNLGRIIDLKNQNTSQGELKEAIKNFQYAAGLFDRLDMEIPSVIQVMDFATDLTTGYLNFVSKGFLLIYLNLVFFLKYLKFSFCCHLLLSGY